MITKIKNIFCAIFIACGLSSCDDFLEILPMNEVVLENYWTEKGDVTSVMNSCYEALEKEDCLVRMGVWGELRSDNLRLGSNVPNEINEILKENILPSNPMCNWKSFYEAINYCNTVCYYAPEVQKIDPNYTEAEMKANVAEASAIRALCYFYLARTFRNVPYTTKPSINDETEAYIIPATPFNAVIDSLIIDLEKVKDDAVRRYYTDESVNQWQNSSKITRWAIYALLADLYLWKGDWDNSIKYCDLVIDHKRQQYEEMIEREGNVNTIGLFGDIPMLLTKPTGSTNCGNAHTLTFGNGNSFESIFELYFANNQNRQNTWVSNYFGSATNSVGRLSAPDFVRKDVALGTNILYKKTDGRAYENVEESSSRYLIRKYVNSNVSYTTQNVTAEKDLKLSMSTRSSNYANWIFYRLSDMLLIKAEALIQRGPDDYPAAFNMINIVNKRANDVTSVSRSDTLKMNDYIVSKASMEDLLLEERHREFMFEGKRWFDLVRVSQRDGNTNRLVSLASRKYIENVNAIKIKLADPNIIYFPYAKSELKANPLLIQNPAYGRDEDSELTK